MYVYCVPSGLMTELVLDAAAIQWLCDLVHNLQCSSQLAQVNDPKDGEGPVFYLTFQKALPEWSLGNQVLSNQTVDTHTSQSFPECSCVSISLTIPKNLSVREFLPLFLF